MVGYTSDGNRRVSSGLRRDSPFVVGYCNSFSDDYTDSRMRNSRVGWKITVYRKSS